MGVAGLLPILKSITKKAHVSKYAGQRAAVDAYCLLHRGAYTCAREIVEGESSAKCVQYCVGRVDLLVRAGLTPVIVFDGGRLPNKGDEERSRERSREENRAKARALWAQGNKTAAYECYNRAVDITPAVAKAFIEALKLRGIEFVVAPYEADAQMAYLALAGDVDVVITEDSDLLAYGCPTVFFKMDKVGDGEEVRLADLPSTREIDLRGWSHDLFQEMCVMAGCDFVKGLPGIGMKKAHLHIRRTRSFIKAVKALRFDGVAVPPDYTLRVQRALWTFRHQRVFCQRERRVVHLRAVAGGDLASGPDAFVPAAAQIQDGEEDFLGPMLPDDVAQAIAAGDLDPISKRPFGERLQQQGTACRDSEGDEAGAGPSTREGAAGGGLFPIFVPGASKAARMEFKQPRPAAAEQAPAEQQRGRREVEGRNPTAHRGQQPEGKAPAAQSKFFQREARQPAAGGGLLASLRAALQQQPRPCSPPPPEDSDPGSSESGGGAEAAAAPPQQLPWDDLAYLGTDSGPSLEDLLSQGAGQPRGRPTAAPDRGQPLAKLWPPPEGGSQAELEAMLSPAALQHAGITPSFYDVASRGLGAGAPPGGGGEPSLSPVKCSLSSPSCMEQLGGEELGWELDAAGQRPREYGGLPGPADPATVSGLLGPSEAPEEEEEVGAAAESDAIADLSHLAACERAAVKAVSRAAQRAKEYALAQGAPAVPAPAPAHLQGTKARQQLSMTALARPFQAPRLAEGEREEEEPAAAAESLFAKFSFKRKRCL